MIVAITKFMTKIAITKVIKRIVITEEYDKDDGEELKSDKVCEDAAAAHKLPFIAQRTGLGHWTGAEGGQIVAI